MFSTLFLLVALPLHGAFAQGLTATCEGLFDRPLAVATSRPLLDLATLDGTTYETLFGQVRARKPDAARMTSTLRSMGATNEQVGRVMAYLEHYRGKPTATNIVAELTLELELARFISDNFWELGPWNATPSFLLERRAQSSDLGQVIRMATARLAETEGLDARAMDVVGFRPRDLFLQAHQEPRRIDGISVWSRLRIVRWLRGPLGSINTAEEVGRLLNPMTELKAQYDPDPRVQWRTCLIYNPAAQGALRKMDFFVVRERVMVTASATQVDHTFLRYYPPSGGEPIIIDFSFNQFSRSRPDGLFVGTANDLRREPKTDPQAKFLHLFDAREGDRVADELGISTESISKIKRALERVD